MGSLDSSGATHLRDEEEKVLVHEIPTNDVRRDFWFKDPTLQFVAWTVDQVLGPLAAGTRSDIQARN